MTAIETVQERTARGCLACRPHAPCLAHERPDGFRRLSPDEWEAHPANLAGMVSTRCVPFADGEGWIPPKELSEATRWNRNVASYLDWAPPKGHATWCPIAQPPPWRVKGNTRNDTTSASCQCKSSAHQGDPAGYRRLHGATVQTRTARKPRAAASAPVAPLAVVVPIRTATPADELRDAQAAVRAAEGRLRDAIGTARASGMTVRGIAEILGVSHPTVLRMTEGKGQ